MKGKILWILGTVQAVIGFALFLTAQLEISGNPWYTWHRPYSSYEAQIIMMKWIGIILLISGISILGLKLYQLRYTSTHTQEITPVTKRGGSITCPGCGLTLSANIATCPRCGKAVQAVPSKSNAEQNGTLRFCSNCGNQVNTNGPFCPKCGQKISK